MNTPYEQSRDSSITNVRIVTPEGIIENGTIVFNSGLITDILPSTTRISSSHSIDGHGLFLLPGLVDIHADSLEAAISPRPSTPFSPSAILPTYDAELAIHGITTVFHCVGLADCGNMTKPLRKREVAKELVDSLRLFAKKSLLHTHIHLRYEITDTESLTLLNEMVKNKFVDLLSVMDHTPGFGVFKDLNAYRDYYHRSGLAIKEADEKYISLMAQRKLVDERSLQELVKRALSHGLTVVSHDDHTPEKIEWAKNLGVTVAEFPVTLEAVDHARKNNMRTVFGSPNLIRNRSHAGNLLVSDMLLSNKVDILCLDYSPRCSLPALFKTAKITGKPLPKVAELFSLNPATSVGLGNKTGSIEVGKRADLILVSNDGETPRTISTFVAGQPVYSTLFHPRRPSTISQP